MATERDASAEALRRQIAALAVFGIHAFRSDDLDELLHRAAELVSEGLGVRKVKVLELLPGGDELLIRAGVNWKPGVVGHETMGAHEDSPGGYALARDEPVISRDLSLETRFRIPDVLIDHGVQSMVNVIIPGKHQPFGVLEVDADQKRDFNDDDTAFLKNYANLLAASIERFRSMEVLEQAAREQQVLIQELAHRVKNMLGLVQSLATQTIADEPAARAFQQTFVGRLQALARAESLVFDDHAQEVELARLIERALEPFAAEGVVAARGPSMILPARIGRIMGLVLHELGTNATKYGSLSTSSGSVSVTWSVEEAGGCNWLRLRWSEQGGPEVGTPARHGFGTRLLTALVSYELDGKAQLNHARGGLVYELEFPVERT